MEKSTATTLTPWVWPNDYIGTDWTGYYIAPCSIHHNSSLLDQVNFRYQRAALDKTDAVLVLDSHWGCGWIEWVAIPATDQAAITIAEGLVEQLRQYPLLDEDGYYSLLDESAREIWGDASTDERESWCARCGVNEQAAGFEHLHEAERYDEAGRLREYLEMLAAE